MTTKEGDRELRQTVSSNSREPGMLNLACTVLQKFSFKYGRMNDLKNVFTSSL